MLYAISGEDSPDSLEKRLAARSEHLERINALQKEGRLILAGPYPAIDSPDPGPAGFSGSLIVAEFESLEAARTWAEADPYATSGVYAKLIVRPFKKVLPSSA
ncbi:MAG: YciI family protein [Pseudomonadota bacterium]|nr:YciI family protein [Pseudomonadota bacterium]